MKNIKLILIFGVLAVALAAAAMLVQKNQETRKSAYFSTAEITILPTEVSKAVGQDIPVHVRVETANGAKADGVRAVLCYGDGSKIGFADAAAANAAVTIGAESGMTSKIVLLREYDGKQCINVTFTSDNDASLLKAGAFEVGVINFKALAAGSVTVETVPARGEVSGNNPADPIDKAMQLGTTVSRTAVTVTAGGGDAPTATPTDVDEGSDGDTLSFKMTYLGVKKSDEHVSADAWKISAIVMGGGVTKVFTDVAPVKLSEVSTVNGVEMRTYRVSLPLGTFVARNDLAVFVRGPKHVQVKYGKDKQATFYNQTGGELDVVVDNVFDFTAYPLLVGDITGPTRGVQDGKIDGRDWVFVNEEDQKAKRLETWDIKADLDANGKLNSADSTALTQSLLERQSQLY